ncbi:ogr/Delta-like zinc finger family protein [Endozoicomonas ascidiicola]|uniref:ogr/Delta-like zinc finger family protein n=1 Tax=Endozoicomonas ascidiicola TaxID=1698521 RepID=UPI00082BD5C9|nr:ogr/Delta-like zinc finger family protein [Endozoicomonas ascidiicola]
MKVTCPNCGYKSGISSSKQMSYSVREIYCHCENPDCDAVFVVSQCFKHYTRPPKPVMEKAVVELVRCLSPQDKKELLAMITHPEQAKLL